MSPQAILFDFDGTLIDSAASVLASLGYALQQSNVTPVVPLDRTLIGPPLRKTLATLTGRDDAALLDALAQAFRDDYDTRGYQRTEVYAGVPEMLRNLHHQQIALHIVTNKRISATRRILDHLGWTEWFAGVYALDALEPAAPNKPHLVAEVLRREKLLAANTWMVGDSAEDRRSAETNALRFFAATWGYGAALGANDVTALTEPLQLLHAAGGTAND